MFALLYEQGIKVSEAVAMARPDSSYLDRQAGIPILTADQEQFALSVVRAGRDARNLLGNEVGVSALTGETVGELTRLVDCGRLCEEHLIQANCRLVADAAKRYLGRGLDFDELVQWGNDGLLKALEKFDPSLGWRFSTYATPWIRQRLSRAVADFGRTIRIPVYREGVVSKVRRAEEVFTAEIGREPTSEELAAAVGVKPRLVRDLVDIAREPLSWDAAIDGLRNSGKVFDAGETSLYILVADASSDAVDPAHALWEKERRDTVLAAITDWLPEPEQQMLLMNFGFITKENGERYSQAEIGSMLGFSKQTVSRLEARALRILASHPQLQDLG